MSSEIPMLSLIKKGSKLFPRYVLAKADEYMNPVYWSGQTWGIEDDALLFANVNEALWTYNELLTESISDRPCHRFTLPLYIEIYGDKPKLADLQEWLEQAMRIVVDSTKYGLGPDQSVGVIIADVEKMKGE